jgi:hypothetical protein
MFVLLCLIPIALPCAALSVVTIGRRPTIGRVIVIAVATAAIGLTLRVGLPAVLYPDVVTIDEAAGTVTREGRRIDLSSRPDRMAGWRKLIERRRAEQSRFLIHRDAALAGFALLLPLAAYAVPRPAGHRGMVVGWLVVALVAQELILRWSNALPPPTTTLGHAVRSSWLPHMALLVWIAAAFAIRWKPQRRLQPWDLFDPSTLRPFDLETLPITASRASRFATSSSSQAPAHPTSRRAFVDRR